MAPVIRDSKQKMEKLKIQEVDSPLEGGKEKSKNDIYSRLKSNQSTSETEDKGL